MFKKLAFVVAVAAYLLLGCKLTWASEAFDTNRLADAIYKAENSKKYPYGIKSIDTHGDKAYARKICLNTIRNNYKRWIKAGKPKPFIEFLGDRYCPVGDDAVGHAVWAKNVARLYAGGIKNGRTA